MDTVTSPEFEPVLLLSQNIVTVHATAVGKTCICIFMGIKLLAKKLQTGGLFIGGVGKFKDE